MALSRAHGVCACPRATRLPTRRLSCHLAPHTRAQVPEAAGEAEGGEARRQAAARAAGGGARGRRGCVPACARLCAWVLCLACAGRAVGAGRAGAARLSRAARSAGLPCASRHAHAGPPACPPAGCLTPRRPHTSPPCPHCRAAAGARAAAVRGGAGPVCIQPGCVPGLAPCPACCWAFRCCLRAAAAAAAAAALLLRLLPAPLLLAVSLPRGDRSAPHQPLVHLACRVPPQPTPTTACPRCCWRTCSSAARTACGCWRRGPTTCAWAQTTSCTRRART